MAINLPLLADGFFDVASPPPAGGQTIFVSPDGADDPARGLRPDQPLQTLKAASQRLRPGQPDRLLLRAGATFDERLALSAGGPTADAPVVVATFGGAGRAVVAPAAETAIFFTAIDGFVAISDLHLRCAPGKAGARPHKVREVLFQNVLVEGASLGYDINTSVAYLHRCITRDCWQPASSGRSQGLYISLGKVVAHQCVFETCGWKPGVPMANPTHAGENHCCYIDEDCPEPSQFKECVFSRPSCHGLQLRPGGTVRECVFFRCPIGGFSQGREGILDGCYFEQQDAVEMGHGTAPGGDRVRGWGWAAESGRNEVRRCAFHHGGSDRPDSHALELAPVKPPRSVHPGGQRIFVSGTRVLNWKGGVRKLAPAADIGQEDVQVNVPGARWPHYTVGPEIHRLRHLDRGGNWNIGVLARRGHEALEAVAPAATVRTTVLETVRSLRAAAAALEGL